jgi:hypothetical protein
MEIDSIEEMAKLDPYESALNDDIARTKNLKSVLIQKEQLETLDQHENILMDNGTEDIHPMKSSLII